MACRAAQLKYARTLLCMLMQLTEQNCNHQPALMYTEN